MSIPRETFHSEKRLAVIREEGPAGVLFGKYPDPPPPNIHNFTAPTSAPGGPIEADVLNISNQVEDIALVSNQEMGFDDDMEPAPDNFPLIHKPSVDTLFNGSTWSGVALIDVLW